jgi:hypothetical protein
MCRSQAERPEKVEEGKKNEIGLQIETPGIVVSKPQGGAVTGEESGSASCFLRGPHVIEHIVSHVEDGFRGDPLAIEPFKDGDEKPW